MELDTAEAGVAVVTCAQCQASVRDDNGMTVSFGCISIRDTVSSVWRGACLVDALAVAGSKDRCEGDGNVICEFMIDSNSLAVEIFTILNNFIRVDDSCTVYSTPVSTWWFSQRNKYK